MDERVREAVAGNTDALADLLFDQHDHLLSRLEGKLDPSLRSAVGVEDALQEAFVQVFRDIGSFRPNSDRAFYRWVETIAENRLLDAVRAQRAKKRGGEHRKLEARRASSSGSMANLFDVLADSLPTPSRNMARNDGIKALVVNLSQLTDDHRTAIQLRHLDGLELEDVATRMGRTVDEVRGLIYRGKKKLRSLMGQSSLYFTKK